MHLFCTGCTEREQVQTVYTMNLFETKSTAAEHTSSWLDFKMCILIQRKASTHATG